MGIDDLKRIAGEIDDQLQKLVGEDSLRTRLTRDLNRARLYVQAVGSGHADLVPERLYRELVQRYRTVRPAEDADEPEEPRPDRVSDELPPPTDTEEPQ